MTNFTPNEIYQILFEDILYAGLIILLGGFTIMTIKKIFHWR